MSDLRPAQPPFRRVAILFAGGPAPAANAVISTCASAFLQNGIEVIGIRHGYSRLIDFSSDQPLQEGTDFLKLDEQTLKRTRNARGILIGTARANPGKLVSQPAHLEDPECVAPLHRVYDGLRSLDVDALISIGGDDTLKTANKLKLFQDRLPPGTHRIPIVHLPKTIDNDYPGIDFPFGVFSAAETLASEIRNLIHDAEARRAYFIAETMGRSAGWLAYAAAIAGEASLVISVEDLGPEDRLAETYTDQSTGETHSRPIMDVERVVNRIVQMMQSREEAGKEFGVVVVAEGLSEYLPAEYLKGVPRDDHGHISIADVNLSRLLGKLLATAYQEKTNQQRKVTGLQLGYESRCSAPIAFDVMLGSQLGVGAYRALVEEQHNGVMVSVAGQLDLRYVPFDERIAPATLVTRVRYIEPNSDFHRLARFLETHINT